MKWPALLFVLSACAADQSAFPVAPSFNPVTDAPITIGHPSATKREYPRGKNGRTLPATREPGVWASDGAPTIPGVQLIGVILPFDLEPREDIAPAVRCAKQAFAVVDASERLMVKIMSLSELQRECLASLMLYECLTYRQAEHAEVLTRRIMAGEIILAPDKSMQSALVALAAHALRLSAGRCRGGDRITESIAEEWSAGLYVRPTPKGPSQ
jgi:hypothetical protein